MKQVWMANDGTVFESEDKCREHEWEVCGVFMFVQGRETFDVDEAEVIFVKDEATYWNCVDGVPGFIGIYGPGWHVWSSAEERFLAWDDIKELYYDYKHFIEEQIEKGLKPIWD